MAAAGRLLKVFTTLFGDGLPLRIRAWDGSEAGPEGGPVLWVRDRQALRRIARQPNELGLGRAYVAGELDVDGDLYTALERLSVIRGRPLLRAIDKAELLRQATLLGVLGGEPDPPPEEIGHLAGAKHSRDRDRAAISHHYDVGNEFYRLVLGPTMVYSCAYFTAPAATLEEAQQAKLDLICRKLGLGPGSRLLDVGCGWGSLALHAAKEYGADVVGVTLSEQQLELARERAAQAGLDGRVDFRLQDYRDVADGPFDAVSSVGMAEHVGEEEYAGYCARLFELLRPGGRLLNHQISRSPASSPAQPSFIESYVFPDGDLSPAGLTLSLIEGAGFEVRDFESLREHYTSTLLAWAANLDAGWERAVKLTSEGRARVWRLYMTASALGFKYGQIGVNQILAVRPLPGGGSGMPPTRAEWLGQPDLAQPGLAQPGILQPGSGGLGTVAGQAGHV
ncbi:SAM-dependent methyltransferase [Longispora albida]|uniref:SAM-dependent methyltransferase n=1 Tax=Longispora albida TaxID=203523 RepID=UPI00037ADF15|nr:cyclopropane-fatty-acyl-phospholipid synthase family protein [Longispora albida]